MIVPSIQCVRTRPERERGGLVNTPRSRSGRVALGAGSRRPALTLLEVLIALAIFLLAMVVFGEMIVRNSQLARDVQRQNLATRLCKSKLNEVISGVVPLSSQGDAPFDEEPDYTWSLDAENGSVDGLWNVTVRVTRTQTDAGDPIECSVTQMVLDPSIEGSTQDAIPVTVSTDNTNMGSSTSGASSTSSGASTSSSSTSTAPTSTPTTPTTPTSTPMSSSSSKGR